MTSGRFDDQARMIGRKLACRYNQPAIHLARECCYRLFERVRLLWTDNAQFDAKWRNCLNSGELANASRNGGVPDDRHSGDAWGYLLQKLQPFRRDCILIYGEPGRIAAWPRKT